jgi:hypothetical protein
VQRAFQRNKGSMLNSYLLESSIDAIVADSVPFAFFKLHFSFLKMIKQPFRPYLSMVSKVPPETGDT